MPLPHQPRENARLEFTYLDGLRGLAAFAVVFHHTYLFTGLTDAAKTDMPWMRPIIGWGYLGVPLFIVLSGYVLMLPVMTRSDGYRVPGGFWKFIWRRARRILPPYWAALVLFALVVLFVPVMHNPHGTQWDTKLPMGWGAFLTHLFLVHDFFPTYIGKINGPMWSVAIEWQIYFLMALLILPMWRLLGGWVTTTVLVAAGLWMGVENRYASMHPWFVGLFAIGMLAAAITVRARDAHLEGRLRFLAPRWTGWVTGALVVAATAAMVLMFASRRLYFQQQTWPSEISIGVLSGIVLTWLGVAAVTGHHTWLSRFLAWRPFVLAGLVSYSVYLFHSPLLALGNLLLLPLGLSTKWQFLVMVVVVVPVTIALCVGFWWLVERNFLNQRQRHAAAEVASREPIPTVETVQPASGSAVR